MMLPIVLDLDRVPVALVGRDAQAVRRLMLLETDGVPRVRVFSDQPSPALTAAAGARLVPRLPSTVDLAGSRVVFIADLAPEESGDVATAAYAAGALVNVEDQRGWCDFHSPSVVRRGDLTIAISTNGKSPALARSLREYFEALFPAVWAARVNRLGRLRNRLRLSGADAPMVAHASRQMIDHAGWLPKPRLACAPDNDNVAPRDSWSGGGAPGPESSAARGGSNARARPALLDA